MVCDCFNPETYDGGGWLGFHPEVQDTRCSGWIRLLELVDEAAADGREELAPLREMSAEERRGIVTLPASISKLTAVKRLVLYGSDLVRLPPEIGAMTSLEKLTPYTSYGLHWFPYEITRCPRLKDSTVSTRALYGNDKYRAPFPALLPPGADARAEPGRGPSYPSVRGADAIHTCSVCDGPVEEASLIQLWISLRVATDVLPLLVNACSVACVQALPPAADGYVRGVHQGGRRVRQPPPRF